MATELPYSIPKYSWWHNAKSKRVFVVADKWYTGVGTTHKLDTIDLLEIGASSPAKVKPEVFQEQVEKGELILLPIKSEGFYSITFI